MKKSFKISTVLLSVFVAAVFFAGCSVSGNTYTFESIKAEGISESTESLSVYENFYKRDIVFSDNGTYTVGGNDAGYYKMQGNKIYVGTYGDLDTSGDPQYVLSGDKLILEKTDDYGVSVKVTFKKK